MLPDCAARNPGYSYGRERVAQTWNTYSKLAPDQEMIGGDAAAAMHQEIERGQGPHQRVFEAGLVPEIAAYAPALVIRDDEKNDDGNGDRAGQRPQRQHRP